MTYDDTTETDFVILQTNINALYTTVVVLVPGSTYLFKVQARNSFGLSAYSEEFSVMVGYKPD